MELSRLADTPELNNALLVGAAVLALLGSVWMLLVTSSFLIHQGIRASGIQALASFGEGLYKRARLTAVLLSFLVVIAGAGVLGYALWQGIDLQPPFSLLLAEVTPGFLKGLGRSVGLLVLLLAGFSVLQRAGKRLMPRVERSLKERQIRETQRLYAEKFLAYLPSVINLALAHAVVSLAVAALGVPAPVEWFVTTSVYILLLVTGGRALVFFLYFLSQRLIETWVDKSRGTRLEEYYTALHRLLPVGQKSLEAIIYISAATLIVRKFQSLEPFSPYGPVLIRIVSMFFAASVVVEFSRVMVSRLLSANPSIADDVQRRRSTFIQLLQNISKYVIYFCVCMMVLSDLGVDPTPILAGAGIVGLTVGLGSQSIVQDLLSGIFLLFEDQILNGDYIRIEDTEGTVEEITPRVTRIRDRYGRLHILRNGEIKNVINYSRGWTLAVVEMSVAYEEDLKKAMQVIADASARLPEMMPGKVIGPPKVMGLESLEDSCLRVRVETRVAPGCHFDAKRALNLLLVEGFRAHKLEIPYPKSVSVDPSKPGDEPAPPSPEPAKAVNRVRVSSAET
ncbi:mechanosensitive ion channel family protein [Stigmatella aurantiaca]|uniref:Mechanosensitive ion channel n=1 Tax=Stigmatella aurantiaca (strain DW4/3-1) TaxID=378806 RepID=Q08PK9_STIAD|nr:mechanosensitive ion channel family protein [Stigmatella aurantiaca]ADO73510.1 mechanosensitive ion channel (MscS) family protein [Stigmatella aurantiaca DW4/3-1]EAU62421.1 mechanosensitive ion channel [Stigmatella aurantiaca DW4/3-1]